MPSPSLPMTMAAGPLQVRGVERRWCRSAAVPKTHTPSFLSCLSRAGMLGTRATGTWLTAPALVLADHGA